jgi:hypothetical protein
MINPMKKKNNHGGTRSLKDTEEHGGEKGVEDISDFFSVELREIPPCTPW